jgi:hypothetical protein
MPRQTHSAFLGIPLTTWREFLFLVKRHWGDGSIRSLLVGLGNYRPTLITRVCPRLRLRRYNEGWSKEDLAAFANDCKQRSRLADLYDLIQERRNDPRRAARTS